MLRLEGDAQLTTITVGDTGPGISPEEVRRLFDRFFRGSTDGRKNPGTGLGLSIVKSLVDLHGGTIDVQSTVGHGTTFVVRLPSATSAARPQAPRPATNGTPSGFAARRVLIVDDEPALAALIAEQLQPLGLQTVQVYSGADALARLRHERFDAITLDVFMPGMNGFDVLRAMRADPQLRDIPVIFVSVASRAPELAGEWAVPKPIDRARLTEVIRAAIQAKRSRVLVVAPDALRTELEPALAALTVEHRWESSPAGALRAGDEERFEVALVHETMGTMPAIVDGSALRGRRYGRSVIVFSTEADGQAATDGVGMPVFGLSQAVGALRAALGDRTADAGR